MCNAKEIKMPAAMITKSGVLLKDQFGNWINECGDVINVIDCPECNRPGAQQECYEALDGGTMNQHERIECNHCGCVVNTREY